MDDGNIEPVATLPTLPRGHPQHSQFVASNNYSRPGLTTNNGYSTTSSYNTHLTQESGLVRYLPSRIQALVRYYFVMTKQLFASGELQWHSLHA